MIISKEVLINITSRNITYYKELGYNIKYKDIISVPIFQLTKGCGVKIKAECDVCKKINSVVYNSYLINIKKYNIYTCSEKCSQIKVKMTNLDKYGVERATKLKSTQNKRKETCLEKYGVENTMYSEELKNKQKETMIKKYGVDSPMKSEELRLKSKHTIINKYGVENVAVLKDVKDKKTITNLKNRGVEFPSQSKEVTKKRKETCLIKYGFEHATQSDEVKKNTKETFNLKFGSDYAMHNIALFNKQQTSGSLLKTHELTGLKYRGTYEKHFLDYCFDNKISIESGMTINYLFETKRKIYYPDFYLKSLNLIIEIKSAYTFNKYKTKNLAKQKSCLEQGYNFIFIIDKNYIELNKLIK